MVPLFLIIGSLPTGCTLSEVQCHEEGFEDGVELGLSSEYDTRIKPPRRCSREGDLAYYEGVLAGCRSTGDTCWDTIFVEDGKVRFVRSYDEVIPDEPSPSPIAPTTQDSTIE